MSSPDEPRPGDADEVTEPPQLQAEIERTAAADDEAAAARDAGPGREPTAADRGPLEAPGAPDELDSDTEGTAPPTPDDEGAATSDVDGDEAPAADAGPPADTGGDETSPAAPEQPAASPPAAADAAARAEPEASAGAKASAANEARADAAVSTDEPPAAETQPEATTPEPTPEPEPDPVRDPLVDVLRQHLGDAVVETHVVPGVDMWARIRPDAWRQAAEVCRQHLGFDYFCFLSAIDWLPSPYGKSEEGTMPTAAEVRDRIAAATDMEHGVCGGETRFQLLARLQSSRRHVGINLKADVPDDALSIETWSTVFPGADWHEREAHEMFGIDFPGHPHLAHIYLPGDFEGHPLRKDYPLLAREVKPWPGIVDVEAMPGEDPAEGDDAEPAQGDADAPTESVETEA